MLQAHNTRRDHRKSGTRVPYWLQRLLTFGLIIGIIGGAILGAGFMKAMRPEVEQKPREDAAPLVNVLSLEPTSTAFSVISQGVAQPVTQTRLSAEVAGTVVEVADSFVAGASFQAGEVLLRIDPTNYEVAVAQAKAAVSQRQVEYDGAKRVREKGYGAEAELLSAKAALESAKADLVRAQRDLERTYVRVPYDGVVRERTAQLGDYVAPGSALGTTFATDRFEVRLPLPDRELAFVELPRVAGDTPPPDATLSGRYRGKPATWQARVVRTEGVVDERTRMVFAVAEVVDPYQRDADTTGSMPLPAGTFVEAAVDGIVVNGVVKIPRTLIRGNNQVIFVDVDNKLRLRNLDILRTDAEYAYVLADQLSEDRVLLTTLEAPLNGMLVRPNDEAVEATADDEPTAQLILGER
ncbi:MAG: efflux RND transporter periplasmic adaptor subunit [Pseudomonadota bacterium]